MALNSFKCNCLTPLHFKGSKLCLLSYLLRCLVVSMNQINHLHREHLETVLMKAAVLMYQKNNNEATAIDTLCKVSHIWWHTISNCHRRKRAAFRRSIDSEYLSLFAMLCCRQSLLVMGNLPQKKTIQSIWFSVKFDSIWFFRLLLCMTQCHCTSI